jgi:hypothetical protein
MVLDLTNRKAGEELNKLPLPSNEGLRSLFKETDRIVIKSDGVYNETAISDNIVLTITAPMEVTELASLLEIDQKFGSFYCMCAGSYAIELFTGDKLITTIGLHHGVSIRYHYWRSDAYLSRQEALLQFLNARGLPAPLKEWLADRERGTASGIARSNWLMLAPSCFKAYVDTMGLSDEDITRLETALNTEIPDSARQITQLLHLFGKSKAPWSGYPVYEEIPMILLDRMPLATVIDTYTNGDKNYKIRRGLARYLFQLRTQNLNLQTIPTQVMDELEKYFKSACD